MQRLVCCLWTEGEKALLWGKGFALTKSYMLWSFGSLSTTVSYSKNECLKTWTASRTVVELFLLCELVTSNNGNCEEYPWYAIACTFNNGNFETHGKELLARSLCCSEC